MMKSWKILENRVFGLKKILEKALFLSWKILEYPGIGPLGQAGNPEGARLGGLKSSKQ